MEGTAFKYSEFFDDDGGLKKVKDDFIKLGEDLIAEAKKVKKEVSANFNFDDTEGLAKSEAQIRNLLEVQKEYAETKKSITKLEKEYNKAQDKQTKATAEQAEAVYQNATALEKLHIRMEQHRVALKAVNQLEKEGTISIEEATIARAKTREEMKKLSKEIQNQTKLEQAQIVVEQQQVKTLIDVRERIAALRVVVQSLDFEAEADKIEKYNKEIDELTDVLAENSDQFIQNKINIGNYEESIKNALKSSNLFKTNIDALDGILESFSGTLLKTTDEINDMEQALGQNANALQKFQIAFGRMNGVLKASVIGFVIVAIAALANAFGNTRKGAINTEKVLQSFQTTLIGFGKASMAILKGIGSFWANVLTGEFEKGKEAITKALEEVGDAFSNTAEAVVQGLEFIDEAFRIEDRVRALNRELEKTNGIAERMQARADDATRSLTAQAYYNKLALQYQQESFRLQKEIAQNELEAINNRIRQNAIANGQEADFVRNAGQGVKFAEKIQELAQQRGSDLEIDNALIEEQHNALIEIQRIENESALARIDNAKQLREINQDIFEQNLDLLIDVIDVQKNLSEAFVNDITKNIKARIDEFTRFVGQFRKNAEDEIKEFNALLKKQADSLGVNAPKFTIEFDENGDLLAFLDGVQLPLDQTAGKITELNKLLQKKGGKDGVISEITINRFRELIIETKNAKRDFDGLAQSIDVLIIKFREMKNEFAITKLEDSNLKRIRDRIAELSAVNLQSIPRRQRLKIMKELKSLVKEQEDILKDGDVNRKQNRIQAINSELAATKTVYVNGQAEQRKVIQEGSEKELELLKEKAALERDIQQGINEERINNIEENNEKAEKAYQKFLEDVQGVIELVFDKIIEMQNRVVQQQEDLLNKQADRVQTQEERAQNGLRNTLAFEQKMQAEREAQLIKAQKKQERIEKIKALWSSYSSYADKEEDPNQALIKTLRDFAILQSIEASFGDGGIVEDKLPGNGIFKGQSHNGNAGGIPILVEGKEGIFSAREMENLGRDNFYSIKRMAGMGKLDKDFLTGQRKSFERAVAIPTRNDDAIVKSMNDVKRAIENKPQQNWRAEEIANGVLKLVEETITPTKTKRHIYKIQKPRI